MFFYLRSPPNFDLAPQWKEEVAAHCGVVQDLHTVYLSIKAIDPIPYARQ